MFDNGERILTPHLSISASALAHRSHGSPKGSEGATNYWAPQHSERQNPPLPGYVTKWHPPACAACQGGFRQGEHRGSQQRLYPSASDIGLRRPHDPHTNSIGSPSHSPPLPHLWRQCVHSAQPCATWFRPFPCALKFDLDSAQRASMLGHNDRLPSLPGQYSGLVLSGLCATYLSPGHPLLPTPIQNIDGSLYTSAC